MSVENMIRPSFIGRYVANGKPVMIPLADRELVRLQAFVAKVLRAEGIARGRNALIISSLAESAIMTPFERALGDLGIVICAAEANPWDGMRTESIIRRFDVAMVAPVTGVALDAIASAGFDAGELFQGKIVWAKPDAYARLEGTAGIDLRRWLEIGPVLAMESRHGGGMLIDGREWLVEPEGDATYVSSRLDRAHGFDRLRIDMAIGLNRTPCATGCPGPRVLI